MKYTPLILVILAFVWIGMGTSCASQRSYAHGANNTYWDNRHPRFKKDKRYYYPKYDQHNKTRRRSAR